MLNPPRRRSPAPISPTTSASPRKRPKRVVLSKLEALESRDLMAIASPILPTPPPAVTVAPDIQAQATPSAGPKIAFVQFQPLTGRVLVVFTGDLAGYDLASLSNPANYSLSLISLDSRLPSQSESRPKAGVVLAPEFQVTGVSNPTPVAPGMPQTVIVSINNNQPFRSGSYRFTIQSSGITDLAGRQLDGDYFGVFPSGDGQPGGNFVARLIETHNTVLPALPATSQPSPVTPPGIKPTFVFFPSTTRVRVRYTSATPGKFTLGGNNNITLVPLAGQNFPGTFRPKPPSVHASSKK
jgi:hypothetical protein